jgi:choline dehydrogenase
VRRIVVDRQRAVAVEVDRSGDVQEIRAAREVVLCAGVIESPKILMLSGIGPAATLETHGIRVIGDAAGVGANLHDHPRASIRWKSLKPLAPSSTSAGLFVRSRGREATQVPDLQFYVGRGLDAVDDFITVTVSLAQPKSRGSVTLRSSDPFAPPLITPNYFSHRDDLDALVDGVRLAREIAATKAYAALLGAAVDPDDNVRTPDQIRHWIRRVADTIFHPVGTCRMGSDASAVVDGQLRVRGVERLRVADGSVMPMVVNSQTNAACLMIGEHAAALLQS